MGMSNELFFYSLVIIMQITGSFLSTSFSLGMISLSSTLQLSSFTKNSSWLRSNPSQMWPCVVRNDSSLCCARSRSASLPPGFRMRVASLRASRDFVLLLASSLVHHDNDYKQFGAAVRCRKITED